MTIENPYPHTAPQPYSGQQPHPAPQVVHHVHHQPPMPYKDTTVAYLLWFFLGGWGADQFYLGRPGPAIGLLVLNFLGWCIIWLAGIGLIFWIPMVIWLIVNACLIPGWVRDHNARAAAAQAR